MIRNLFYTHYEGFIKALWKLLDFLTGAGGIRRDQGSDIFELFHNYFL